MAEFYYVSGPEYLKQMICRHYDNVQQFVEVVNGSQILPDVKLSKSLVDSWICGRRDIGLSSSILVWKIARILSFGVGSHNVYCCMRNLLEGHTRVK